MIGHLKSEHRMARNYLWHRQGDASNAVLAAVGYNFRRLIRWLKLLLFQILAASLPGLSSCRPEKPRFFTDDALALSEEPNSSKEPKARSLRCE